MLSQDRMVLRNVVLTAAAAMGGALLLGTTCVGKSTVGSPSATVAPDETARRSSVGGVAAPLTAGTTNLTGAAYAPSGVEGSSASGQPTDAPSASAPPAVPVRGRVVLAAPAATLLVQQPTPPVQTAPPANASASPRATATATATAATAPSATVPAATVPVPVVVPNGAPVYPTPTNATQPAVPTPSASTPGYAQPAVPASPPATGVPQAPAGSPPQAPPTGLGTGFAQSPGAGPPGTPQTGLGTGFGQTPPPR